MRLIYKYIQLLLALHIVLTSANAQTCEWLNVAGGPQNESPQDITVDGDNNPILVGGFSSTTFPIGSYTFSGYNTANLGYIVKYNPLGSLIWAKQSSSTSATAGTCVFYEASTDDSDNIYVISLISGTVNFGSGITVTSSSAYNYALVKFDSSGNTKWVRTSTGGSASGAQYHVKVDKDNNVFISSVFANTINFNGASQSLTSAGNTDIFIAKYTPNGTLIRAKKFGGVRAETCVDMDVDGRNNYYIMGFSQSTFTYGSQTLSDTGEVILKMDSALNPLLAKKTKTNYSSNGGYGIAVTDSGECVVLALVTGTANYGNGVTLTAIGGFGYTNSIVFYDRNLTAKWARRNDSMATMTTLMPQARVNISSSYIYFGGFFGQGSTRFGSHVLTYKGANNYYLVKMDTLGNFLWAFNSGDNTGGNVINPLCADKNGDVLIEGVWGFKITVFNKKDSTWAGGNDMFVAKVSDYSITRGFVSSGPYCAGDTIIIPYTKKGLFKPGNEFIAHLSDSAGNFDGGERELGRVTDTGSGVIKGLLPLFNVASNNKYRIRILSTSPSVESYYRLDTLRLLVYSKDTANAGADTTLCSGQIIRLGTTGGSRWNWSPATGFINPGDTANRQPLVRPLATVQYRIIISDSSGCGKIDTDYVVINVRPYISINIQGSRVICRGAQTKLLAAATGGDSTRYWYNWKQQSPSSSFSSRDPYVFVNPTIKTTYAVTMGDSCSDKLSTATVTIQVDTVLKVYKSNDTAVCRGNPVTLKAWGNGCDTSQYSFTWYRKGDNTQLGSADTFTITADSTTIFKVLLVDVSSSLADSAFVKVGVDNVFITDAGRDSTICKGQNIKLKAATLSCDTSQVEYTWDNGVGKGQTQTVSPATTTTYTVIAKNLFNRLSDTDRVTITVKPALSVTINTDTTICKGETAQLRATAAGGNSTYKLSWTADNSSWTDTNFITSVAPDSTTVYTAVLSDGCTVKPDTAKIKVSVRPPLKVTVNADTIICMGETAQLRATATGGLPANYKLNWKTDNSSWTDTQFTTAVNPVLTTRYTAVLNDNCTKKPDSATVKVTVRLPLKVTVNKDTTICYGGSVNLLANTGGGLTTNHHILWKENLSSWTDTNLALIVSPAATTTYTATLTDNCTTDPDSAKVTVTVLSLLSVSATAKDSICQGQTVTLNAALNGGKISSRNLTWTAIPGTFTSTQNPAKDTPQITTTYIAKLSDNCSPSAFDTLTVTVLPKPIADFSLDPKEGCPPLLVSFTDLSVNTDSTKNIWHILATEAFGIKNYGYEFLHSGSFTVGLTVGNSLGCTDIITKPNAVTVFEKPIASFTVKPDIKEVDKELLLINNSQKATRYTWDFGNGAGFTQANRHDTNYTYTDSGYYNISLVAENDKGCKDTGTQLIRVHDRLYCAIPSAFTPGNLDNLNPVFQPLCTGVKSYTLTIYNRWGQVIQDCENCSWDGTYLDKPVPSETYLYKIFIIAESGKKETLFGIVNVLR